MKYEIKYTYDTGDSFHTDYDVERTLGTWENVEIAEENLKRIREHYEFYQAVNSTYYREREKQKAMIAEAPSKAWYVPTYEYCLKLLADNNEPYQFSAPWCGYFETLKGVVIEEAPNPNRSYYTT